MLHKKGNLGKTSPLQAPDGHVIRERERELEGCWGETLDYDSSTEPAAAAQ